MSLKNTKLNEKFDDQIYSVIKVLETSIEKVKISSVVNNKGFISEIIISHANRFMPDFKFILSPEKTHYRVYMLVANIVSDKVPSGYAICVIKSGIAAANFCTMYEFIYNNRANNKEVT